MFRRWVQIFSLSTASSLACCCMPSHAGESTEDPSSQASAHEQHADCFSPAGILLCSDCREHQGLPLLLTPGNSNWRIQPESQSDSHSKFVSFEPKDRPDGDEKKGRRKSGRGERPRRGPSHREMPRPNIQAEQIELLQNILRTLKSIEGMMRQEKQNDVHERRPGSGFGGSPMRGFQFGGGGFGGFRGPIAGPMGGGHPGPDAAQRDRRPQGLQPPVGPQRANGPRRGPGFEGHGGPSNARPNNAGPRREGPPDAGPRDEGARREMPRNAGPREEGPRRDGPRDAGPRDEGARRDMPRDAGPREEGPRRDGPRDAGPRDEGARREMPRDAGPREVGPPRDGGGRDAGPRDGGRREPGPGREAGPQERGREQRGPGPGAPGFPGGRPILLSSESEET